MSEEHSKVAMKAFLSTQKKNLAFLYDKKLFVLDYLHSQNNGASMRCGGRLCFP